MNKAKPVGEVLEYHKDNILLYIVGEYEQEDVMDVYKIKKDFVINSMYDTIVDVIPHLIEQGYIERVKYEVLYRM